MSYDCQLMFMNVLCMVAATVITFNVVDDSCFFFLGYCSFGLVKVFQIILVSQCAVVMACSCNILVVLMYGRVILSIACVGLCYSGLVTHFLIKLCGYLFSWKILYRQPVSFFEFSRCLILTVFLHSFSCDRWGCYFDNGILV